MDRMCQTACTRDGKNNWVERVSRLHVARSVLTFFSSSCVCVSAKLIQNDPYNVADYGGSTGSDRC